MDGAGSRSERFAASLSRSAAGGLLAAGIAAGGCYSHVTQARGPGSERYKVYERNTDDIILGKWFGEPGKGGEPAPPK